jgi:hypothetical protein
LRPPLAYVSKRPSVLIHTFVGRQGRFERCFRAPLASQPVVVGGRRKRPCAGFFGSRPPPKASNRFTFWPEAIGKASMFIFLPIPARRPASPPPRPARNAGFTSASSPPSFSRNTAPSSSRRGWHPALAAGRIAPNGLQDTWSLRSSDDPQEVRPRPRVHARGRSQGDGRTFLTPLLTPTDPNRDRLGPTASRKRSAMIPHVQDLFGHQPAPEYSSASLESDPASLLQRNRGGSNQTPGHPRRAMGYLG